MFGGPKRFDLKDVEAFLKQRGLQTRVEQPSNPNDFARFSYVDREVPFWLTLSARDHQIDGLTFFTAVPSLAGLQAINDFNAKYKFSKAYLEGGSTCCTMSAFTHSAGFDALFLQKSFALWELGLPAFGELIVSVS